MGRALPPTDRRVGDGTGTGSLGASALTCSSHRALEEASSLLLEPPSLLARCRILPPPPAAGASSPKRPLIAATRHVMLLLGMADLGGGGWSWEGKGEPFFIFGFFSSGAECLSLLTTEPAAGAERVFKRGIGASGGGDPPFFPDSVGRGCGGLSYRPINRPRQQSSLLVRSSSRCPWVLYFLQWHNNGGSSCAARTTAHRC